MSYNHDENPNDLRQYCQHGTFIGSWWGPDYLCGWCEDGISVAEMRASIAAQARRERETRATKLTTLMDTVAATAPWSARTATYLVSYVWTESAGL